LGKRENGREKKEGRKERKKKERKRERKASKKERKKLSTWLDVAVTDGCDCRQPGEDCNCQGSEAERKLIWHLTIYCS
jgi:hypothetical protein